MKNIGKLVKHIYEKSVNGYVALGLISGGLYGTISNASDAMYNLADSSDYAGLALGVTGVILGSLVANKLHDQEEMDVVIRDNGDDPYDSFCNVL
jgi:hypothetical protein